MKLTFVKNQPEAGNAISFFFEKPADFDWQAGQYMHYTLPVDSPRPDDKEHFFTISSASTDPYIQLTTRQTGSPFKTVLAALKPGGTIEADGPEGDFTWQNAIIDQHIFIAGGIGITPFRALLHAAAAKNTVPTISLFYGNKTTDGSVFRAELTELSQRFPTFHIYDVLSPAVIDAPLIAQLVPDLTVPLFWVSGPEPMVEAMEQTLSSLGIPDERQKRDYFPGYPDENK